MATAASRLGGFVATNPWADAHGYVLPSLRDYVAVNSTEANFACSAVSRKWGRKPRCG